MTAPTMTAGSTSSTKSRSAGPRGAHKTLQPFTIDHFRSYARKQVLDNGSYLEPEDFQLMVTEDLLDGRENGGIRTITEHLLVLPEGNAKTTYSSLVALYYCDFIVGADVLMAASTRDQAGLLFGQAQGFIERSPGMAKRFRVYEGYRRIKCTRPNSPGRIQVFAADDGGGDGVFYDLAIIDEGHRHKNLKLLRTWRGKTGKKDGQLLTISTAGEPDSEFENYRQSMHDLAVQTVRDGRHVRAQGEESLVHEWALLASDDPTDCDIVKLANPLSTITPDKLRKKRTSPSHIENHWLRFTCNIATRELTTAISEPEWAARRSSKYTDIPEGVPVDVGMDIAWKWDTTALVPLWLAPGEPKLIGLPTIIVPPRDGNSIEVEVLQDALKAIHKRNPIRRVVMDPEAGGEQFAQWITKTLGIPVVAHSQKNGPMTLAAGRFTEALRDDRIHHCGDDELTVHVLNAVAHMFPDGTFKFERPNKTRSAPGQDRRVIDGLIAAAIVHSMAEDTSGMSPYEHKEMLVLGDDDLYPDLDDLVADMYGDIDLEDLD